MSPKRINEERHNLIRSIDKLQSILREYDELLDNSNLRKEYQQTL